MEASSLNKYEKEKLIGCGSFGQAWLVRGPSGSRRYVQKEVRVGMLNGRERLQAMTEVEALARCKHQNVIRYREAFFQDKDSVNQTLCIVMEFADSGDLCQRVAVQQGSLLEAKVILDWFVQICFGLRYIHGIRILHRDLKTSNIFLTIEGIVKIGDFGIARFLGDTADQANTFIGTPYYLSPEICQHKPYDFKSDMWSAGCVLYELCSLERPFAGNTLPELIANIVRGKHQLIPSCYPTLIQDLVEILLRPDPSERPTSSEVLSIALIRPIAEDYVQRINSRPRTSLDSTKDSHSTERRVLDSIRQRTPLSVEENGLRLRRSDSKDSPIRVTSSKPVNRQSVGEEFEAKRSRQKEKENADNQKTGHPSRSRHKSCSTPVSFRHHSNDRANISSAEPLLKRREEIRMGPKLALYREVVLRQPRAPVDRLSTQPHASNPGQQTDITSSPNATPTSRQLEISRKLLSGFAPTISSIPSHADSLRCFLRSRYGPSQFRQHHYRIKDMLSASSAPGVVKSSPGVNSPGGIRNVDRMLSALGDEVLQDLPLFVQLSQLEFLASLA